MGSQWSAGPGREAEAGLQRLWLLMQAFWLPALLLPGGLAILGPAPSRGVLRPFNLRPLQILVVDVLAGTLDVPTLLALLLTLPLVFYLLAAQNWGTAFVALAAFLLLGLQTGLLARLLAYLGRYCLQRLRRWAEIPTLAAFLLVCLCVAMPPAFASLTVASRPHAPLLSSQTPYTPSRTLSSILPSSLATHAVVSAGRADYLDAAKALAGLVALLGLTGCGALLVYRGESLFDVVSDGRSFTPSRTQSVPNVQRTRAGTLSQLRAATVTEWRLLLRTPQKYLPLRKPAAVLLLGAFALLSPDMGHNPVYNLEELLGIGALLYSVLWQVQLLCDRFGNEVGTGALLFGLSLPRRRLLLSKNLALFSLLLLLDCAEMAGLSLVAGTPRLIPLLLLWLPMILLVLTAMGNVISVLQPFPIARLKTKNGGEPPDSLAAVYLLVGGATAVLLAPVPSLLSRGVGGALAVAAYLGALYAASLYTTGALLTRREPFMITRLDRGLP